MDEFETFISDLSWNGVIQRWSIWWHEIQAAERGTGIRKILPGRHLPCWSPSFLLDLFITCSFWTHLHHSEAWKTQAKRLQICLQPWCGEGNASVLKIWLLSALCLWLHIWFGKSYKCEHKLDHTLPKAPDFPVLPLNINSFGHWIALIFKGGEGGETGEKEGFFLFTVLLFKQFQLGFEKHLPFRSIKWLQAKFPSVLNLCLLAGDNFLLGLFKKKAVQCDNSLLTWACMEAWKLWEPKSFSHSNVIQPIF